MHSLSLTVEPSFDVVIVGCGPTGAMLAAELRLHDVRVLVLEQETEPKSFVRIVGLHIRSIELLAMRGLLDRILEHGRRRPAGGFFAAIAKPVPTDLDSAHAYLLDRTERLTVGGWSDRVDHLADPTAALDVPCVLLRPDGHVAWVGDDQRDLNDNLARWFGEPAG